MILDDYDIEIIDDDFVSEASVGKMNPEQKAKHEERKMHKAEIRHAESLGYDTNKAKREKMAEERKSNGAYIDSEKERLRELEKEKKSTPSSDTRKRAKIDRQIKSQREEIREMSKPLTEKRKRTLPGTFDAFERLGDGSTTDASGRKHNYSLEVSGTGDATDPSQKKLFLSPETLKGKEDFDYAHNHEVGHMAQYDSGLFNDVEPRYPKVDKKSMGPAEDYAFKCAQWFVKKYKSKLNSHDIQPTELHADYLAARKVGFNRVYKGIKSMGAGAEDRTGKPPSVPDDINVLELQLGGEIKPTRGMTAPERARWLIKYINNTYGIDFDIQKYVVDKSYRDKIKNVMKGDGKLVFLNKFMASFTENNKKNRKDNRTSKSTYEYRALFIQDMMWLHKGRRDRCSMKYPEWTPEEKKAFMEFYIDDELTEGDVIEMEEFVEYMTNDIDDDDEFIYVEELRLDDDESTADVESTDSSTEDTPDVDTNTEEPTIDTDETSSDDDGDETIEADTIDDFDSDDGSENEEEPSDDSVSSEGDSSEDGEPTDDNDDEEETISIDTMTDDMDKFADDMENPSEPVPNNDEYFGGKNPYQTQSTPATVGIDVSMSTFGTDNSPVQNQYNPKEVERLNTLVASENSAIGEYFQASKETNVDVLRRLYSDIGEEERFHAEQLLFAKSQITGERYIPRDPDIKKEYEELLSMGMDEETAMTTAADKVGLFNKNIELSPVESAQEMAFLSEQAELITESLYQEYMVFKLMESSNTYSPRERDRALNTFIEAYIDSELDVTEFFTEAVANNTEAKPAPVASAANTKQNNGGILKGIGRVIGGIVRFIGKLIGIVVNFVKRRFNHLKTKLAWLKNHKITDIFKSGFHLYFYNDNGGKVGFAYDDAARYLIRLINCCIMIAKQEGTVEFNYGTNQMKFKELTADNFKPATLEDAIKNIKNVQLIKTKVILDDHNAQLFLKEAFGVNPEGNSTDKVQADGVFSKIKLLLEDFDNAAKALEKLTNDFSSSNTTNQPNSLYVRDKDKYNKLVGYLKDVTKGYQLFMNCLSNDITVLTKIDSEFTRIASEQASAAPTPTETQPGQTTQPAQQQPSPQNQQQQPSPQNQQQQPSPQNQQQQNQQNDDKAKKMERVKLNAQLKLGYSDGFHQITKALTSSSSRNTIISELNKVKAEFEKQKASIGKSNTVKEYSNITIIDDINVVQESLNFDRIKRIFTTDIKDIRNVNARYKTNGVKEIYAKYEKPDIDKLIDEAQNNNIDPKMFVIDTLIQIVDEIIKGIESGQLDISSAADLEQIANYGNEIAKVNKKFRDKYYSLAGVQDRLISKGWNKGLDNLYNNAHNLFKEFNKAYNDIDVSSDMDSMNKGFEKMKELYRKLDEVYNVIMKQVK